MGGYLANFAVYTLAMIGLIFFALFVYKKFAETTSAKSDFLKIEDRINLGPRKTLCVVRAGKERFLIASDVDKTSLISKLDEKSKEELPVIVDFPKKPVMKQMLEKIKDM